MLKLLGRGLAILFAFAVAAVVAVVVLFTLGSAWVGDVLYDYAEGDPLLEDFSGVMGIVVFASAVGPALSALPGLAAVAVGEVMRLRSWLYYVPAGGGALALIPLLIAPGAPDAPAADYMTIFASAGFAAGFVYWLLAGRWT